jgi:hypothetical protein
MMWFASVFAILSARRILPPLICLAAFLALPSRAGISVSLVWDSSADSNIAGYKIYYGTTSHDYTSSVDVGKVTQASIAIPSANKTYYFAATTYDTSGLESDYSNEATYAPAPDYKPPTLGMLNNLSLGENAGIQSVKLSGIALGTGSALNITASSSNPSLIPNPGVNYTSPASSGSLTFLPAPNMTGTATITVTADNGQPQSNLVIRTFVVTVLPPDQLPALDPIGNLTLAYSSAGQTVSLTGIESGSSSGNQRLKISAKSSNSKVVPNPKVSHVNGQMTGNLTVKPAANASGSAEITVTVNNGAKSNNIITRTFTVTVLPNNAPTLDAIGGLTLAYNSVGTTVNLTGIGTGSSGENQRLKISAKSSNSKLVSNPKVSYVSGQTTGSLTVKPARNASGTAEITVTVNDGGKSNNIVTRTFTVTVLTNNLPTLNPIGDLTLAYNSASQTVELSGIGDGSSGENQRLKISAKSSNSKLVSNPKVSYVSGQTTGSLTVKPAANVSGTAEITVTVNDGGTSNNIITRTFAVTVLPNNLPTLDSIDDLTFAYNSAEQTVNLTGIGAGSSGENQRLTVSAQSSNSKLIPSPKVSYVSGQTTGSLTMKPAANMSGTAEITVIVNDGGKSNNIVSRTFTVTVLTNNSPTLDPIGNLILAYNSAGQTVELSGIGAGASGEIQRLTISAQSSDSRTVPSPRVSYVNGQTTGSLTVKPAHNASGTAEITVMVNDGGKSNNIVTQTFTVTVLPEVTPSVAQSPVAHSVINMAAVLTSAMNANGQFSLTVNGVPGYQYTVEASLDLIHWTPVYTNTAPFTFEDDQTGEYSGQFYRAVYQP